MLCAAYGYLVRPPDHNIFTLYSINLAESRSQLEKRCSCSSNITKMYS